MKPPEPFSDEWCAVAGREHNPHCKTISVPIDGVGYQVITLILILIILNFNKMKKTNIAEKIVLWLLAVSVISLLILFLMEIWDFQTGIAGRICGSLFIITFFAFIFSFFTGKISTPE